MATNLYVGNFTFSTTESDLRTLFSEFGEVVKAQVITDRETGRSRGFGFVEMGSDEAANKAVASLDGRNVGGRSLTVNVAKPRR
jgi:RNA recognition motif-containing protein